LIVPFYFNPKTDIFYQWCYSLQKFTPLRPNDLSTHFRLRKTLWFQFPRSLFLWCQRCYRLGTKPNRLPNFCIKG
jgi:hypothetical protein